MTREQYESLPAAELKKIAKSRGLRVSSGMRKGEVVELMLEEDQKEAIAYACKLRAEDQKVELVRMSRRHDLQEYIDYAHKILLVF